MAIQASCDHQVALIKTATVQNDGCADADNMVTVIFDVFTFFKKISKLDRFCHMVLTLKITEKCPTNRMALCI